MRTRVTFLAGFATGYVLGSRAGRARYEQIRAAATAFVRNPAVQSTASTLQQQAEGALSSVKDKAATSIGSTLQEKRPGWLGGPQETTTNSSPTGGTNGRPA